jgi:hypothetical protein
MFEIRWSAIIGNGSFQGRKAVTKDRGWPPIQGGEYTTGRPFPPRDHSLRVSFADEAEPGELAGERLLWTDKTIAK